MDGPAAPDLVDAIRSLWRQGADQALGHVRATAADAAPEIWSAGSPAAIQVIAGVEAVLRDQLRRVMTLIRRERPGEEAQAHAFALLERMMPDFRAELLRQISAVLAERDLDVEAVSSSYDALWNGLDRLTAQACAPPDPRRSLGQGRRDAWDVVEFAVGVSGSFTKGFLD